MRLSVTILSLGAILLCSAISAQTLQPVSRNVPIEANNVAGQQLLLQTPDGSGCIPIPDGSYDGSLASMACGGLVGPTGVITDVDLALGVDHTWVGDLVFKLVPPSGSPVVTLMSRPGLSETVDDGSGCCGFDADMSSSASVAFNDQGGGVSAESMGAAGSVVCAGDGVCNYTPSSGAAGGGGLSAFNGQSVSGNWTICVGDAEPLDSGQLCSGSLIATTGTGGGGGGITASIQNPFAFTDCISTNVSFTLVSNGGSNGGTVHILVFDDMAQEYQQTVSIPAGSHSQNIQFSYPDPTVGTGAPGIGLALFSGLPPSSESLLDAVDPLDVEQEALCSGSAPVVELSLSPNPVAPGANYTISWNATRTVGSLPCIAALGGLSPWSQTQFRPAAGSNTYSAPTTPGTVDFAMECEGANGLRGDDLIRLTVSGSASAPTVDLNSTPLRTAPGGAILLSWITNISSGGNPCTPTGGSGTTWAQLGSLPANGRRSVAAPSGNGAVSFGLQCSNGGANGSDSTSVTVATLSNPPPPPRPGPSSVTRAGTTATGTSKAPSLTRDGSALVFGTTAADIASVLPGQTTPYTDNNGVSDIFLKFNGVTDAVLCSVSETGPLTVGTFNAKVAATGAGATFESSDGQIRTFEGTIGRTRGVTSSNAAGVAGNAASANPSINGDATMVAFDSNSTNLVPNDGNGGMTDVFFKEPATGAIQLVSQGRGAAPANGESSNPSISVDGSTIMFETTATNMDGLPQALGKAQPKGGTTQICGVRNPNGVGRTAGCVSVNTVNGQAGNGSSRNARMSMSGEFGVFESDASNLVTGDTNNVTDIFWFTWDGTRVTGMVRVSTGKNGEQANGASTDPSISEDGMTVTFKSLATNLAPPDSNGVADPFMKYVQSGQIIRMSTTASGSEPNGASGDVQISGDGTTVAFTSDASNLINGDNNGSSDVFTVSAPQVVNANEPGLIQAALPAFNPPNPSCPAGFFIVAVDDGPLPGLTSGIFGVELALDSPGTRRLEGGLNFGGLVDVSQVGFAGVNFANAANEPQRLNISLTGNPSTSLSGTLPVRIKVARQPAPNVLETVFESVQNISNAQPFTTSVTVPPGFYVATVAAEGFPASAAGGPAEGQFFFALTTSFVDRPGGGFQGGAVVGGYHATNPFAGVSGFAAFCIASTHSSTIRTFSAPTYGASGAGDIRLRVLDQNQQNIYSVPGD